MEERKKQFLETHRKKLIKNIRNPSQLADALLQKNDIDKELYTIIRNKITVQEQNREIFLNLNTTLHFAHVYDWLKENESGLLKELENCDPEAAAPQKY
ncbi:hypothetical protein QTP86_032714 [Hemibagrus guttatus]|nr:hypothetical protein QTP86_032714 [Hemibagrus guttatus]